VQPGIIMLIMQSQQAWIILADIASPEVQLIMQPISIISTLHMPIGILHMQHIMPFIIMHMPIIPLAFIMQSCCIIAAAVLSSHMQVHFMPPAIFSIFIVQRGTIIPFMPMPIGIVDIEGIIPMPLIPIIEGFIIPIRSLIIVPVMANSVVKIIRLFRRRNAGVFLRFAP
jgi:hypothetical protein